MEVVVTRLAVVSGRKTDTSGGHAFTVCKEVPVLSLSTQHLRLMATSLHQAFGGTRIRAGNLLSRHVFGGRLLERTMLEILSDSGQHNK